MRFWQIAAGDGWRHYADLCLQFDVILNGPGWAGPWPECAADLKKSGVSSRKLTELSRFCDHIEPGDIVVLRVGTQFVYGVGRIQGSYEHNSLFSDVEGWELQHVRRVQWLWKAERNTPKDFGVYALRLGDTTQELRSQPVLDWAASFINEPLMPLANLPQPGLPLSPEELVQPMYDYGLSTGSVNETTAQIADLVRLARWYARFGGCSESETVSHVVVPLLRALGWTAQRTAVEWSNIDIALFGRVPRVNASIAVVVEVKALNAPIWPARDQAFGYALAGDRAGCHRVVVTDGFRYGVFIRKNSRAFHERPVGYLNLASPMSAHPLWNCPGAGEALLWMSADWQPELGMVDLTPVQSGIPDEV